MKKQTAVEWLHMKLDVYFELFPSEWQKLNQIIEEAKEMERDQIIDAYLQGSFNWERQGATQFYNETYGGDK
jgi:Leu/Phe-tRNA-protein transferase